ncbi:MAG: YdcH family protein [Gammaproteobacteria bacterium]|nr:YdcH family protein [Gammaproteobacteria bacterium]
MANANDDSPDQRLLVSLEIEHADLDAAINELAANPYFDELRLRRLKAKKLQLKDDITRLRSKLIPNLDA